MQNTVRKFCLPAIATIMVACGPASAGSPPSPAIPSEGSIKPSAPISKAGSWRLQPITTDRSYIATSNTALELIDSSRTLRDTLTTRTDFRMSASRDIRATIISATINSLSLDAGPKTGIPEKASVLPFVLIGRFQNNRLTFNQGGSQSANIDCADPASSSLSIIQRSLIVPPLELHTGMTWTDSISAELCSGAVPITVVTTRNYRVLGESFVRSVPVILLERHERIISTGEGSSGQHRITLHTEGAGSGQVAIDRLTGFLVDDVSTYTAAVIVRSSGRDQRFAQVVNEHIALKLTGAN